MAAALQSNYGAQTHIISEKKAITFVILLGLVSLLADITYEGARSISGQYLSVLGASGFVVGIVAGLGELINYGFRLLFGYISDKTGKYWTLTLIGYTINLFAVPMLALAGNWQMATGLLILERFGKSIRTPSRDAMLSYATKEVGRGWGFGLHEAMDQIGAITGPLIVSFILYTQKSYQESFAILLIPALCAISVLAVARFLYPRPQDLESSTPQIQTVGLSRNYWIYIASICCIAAGYIDFPLIAFHLKKTSFISDAWIPVFYAVAMTADGIAALVIGRLYDKKGLSILIYTTLLASLFVPFVLMDGFYFALIGVILWGIGLGAQESVMRAAVSLFVPKEKRGTAYGMMNIWFGLTWFLGSALMGLLYDSSLIGLALFSIGAQLAAIPFLLALKK